MRRGVRLWRLELSLTFTGQDNVRYFQLIFFFNLVGRVRLERAMRDGVAARCQVWLPIIVAGEGKWNHAVARHLLGWSATCRRVRRRAASLQTNNGGGVVRADHGIRHPGKTFGGAFSSLRRASKVSKGPYRIVMKDGTPKLTWWVLVVFM